MLSKTRILALAILLTLTAVPRSHAAFSLYLHIDGITGSSTAASYPGDLVCSSFTWNVTNNAAGQPVFSGITFVKSIDQASPTLALECANGATNATATLYLVTGSNTTATYKIVLTNVQVTSVSVSGDATAGNTAETFTLRFTDIQWTYVINPMTGQSVVTSWNLVTNSSP